MYKGKYLVSNNKNLKNLIWFSIKKWYLHNLHNTHFNVQISSVLSFPFFNFFSFLSGNQSILLFFPSFLEITLFFSFFRPFWKSVYSSLFSILSGNQSILLFFPSFLEISLALHFSLSFFHLSINCSSFLFFLYIFRMNYIIYAFHPFISENFLVWNYFNSIADPAPNHLIKQFKIHKYFYAFQF